MIYLIAQASDSEPSTLVSLLFLGALAILPVLAVLLAVAFFQQMKMTRTHINRAEAHWQSVETLLAQIAENTRGKPG